MIEKSTLTSLLGEKAQAQSILEDLLDKIAHLTSEEVIIGNFEEWSSLDLSPLSMLIQHPLYGRNC